MLSINGQLITNTGSRFFGPTVAAFSPTAECPLMLRAGLGSNALAAVPMGYGGQKAVVMPQTAGAMKSVVGDTGIAFAGAAPINKGISITASGSAFEFGGTAGLGAVVRMTASGNALTFSGSAGIYGVASMSASGTVLTFTGSALLGGLFSIEASGSAFAFGGSATTHSLAFLETTEVSGEMSETTIAAAVWSKVLGGLLTAEDTLLAAGSAGDPWSAIIDGQLAGEIMAMLKRRVAELHKIQGLDATAPVTHAPGSITAGDIAIDLGGDNVNSRTKTRRA